ncbi:hypothetical protein G6F55_007572 [Rhizopus delemar]|nr:hypothetical protein G6F55_007572 [Rhizopus delemar]
MFLAAHEPRLTARHRKSRLRWAKEHLNWTEDQWRSVVWSDESRFCVEGSKRGKRVLRKEGERYDERNIIFTVKWGGGGAMVWGCFRRGGFGLLEMIDTSSVDQETYISILANMFHHWFTIVTIQQERGLIFQEDGASCHTEGYVRCPALNPIEHVWNALEKRIERKRSSVKSLGQLKVALREEFLPYLEVLVMYHSSKQLEQLQADLAAAHNEIRKLQQENTFLRNQLAPKPSITNIPPSPSGYTISPTVSFLSHSSPSSCKRPPSPNNASTPLPKVAKPKRDNSQSRLTAIARQFSSPAEPTGFKPIHVPIRHRFPLQQLRPNLRRLHINTRRIMDIHYSDRNLVSFLIHIGYETELRLQVSKFNVTVRDDFDPLDPSIIRDPTLVNEPIDNKIQHVRKAFLHRICVALRRFRTPIYNAVANFFVQSGLIDLDNLASYDLAPPYKHCTGHILDYV